MTITLGCIHLIEFMLKKQQDLILGVNVDCLASWMSDGVICYLLNGALIAHCAACDSLMSLGVGTICSQEELSLP